MAPKQSSAKRVCRWSVDLASSTGEPVPMTRRHMLAGAAGISSLVFLPQPCSLAGGLHSLRSPSVFDMTLRHWEMMLGQRFQVHCTGGETLTGPRLRLVEVTNLSVEGDIHRPAEARREPYSLLFVSTNGSLPGETHTLFHPRLGKFSMLLQNTRVKAYVDQDVYEAIVN